MTRWTAPRTARVLTVLLAAAVGILLTGCSGNESGPLDGSWRLTSFAVDSTPVDEFDSVDVTMDIAGTGVRGSAPCNTYSATIVESTGWGLDDLTFTELACEPASTMDLESAYFFALIALDAAQVDGDELVLTGSDGLELRFARD